MAIKGKLHSMEFLKKLRVTRQDQVIYVDIGSDDSGKPLGKDSNSGTMEKPLATIDEAIKRFDEKGVDKNGLLKEDIVEEWTPFESVRGTNLDTNEIAKSIIETNEGIRNYIKLRGEIMNIVLTEDQKEKYEVVRWLLSSGSLRSGKTMLMAMAFIDKAIREEGEVLVYDHIRDPRMTNHLLRQIESLFATMEASRFLDLVIKKSNYSIKLVKKLNRKGGDRNEQR